MNTIKNFIPSLITLCNLSCGFAAIMLGELELGALLIIAGAVADVFDGAVARMLNATSNIGLQLDSLADIVSFGLAPAYLYYIASDFEYKMIPCLFFTACAAYRLAKFNTLPPSKYFIGVASPAAGLFLTGLIFAYANNSTLAVSLLQNPISYALIPIVMGIFMNMNLKMFSFKSLKGDLQVTKLPYLIPILIILIGIFDYKLLLSGSILSYILVGILYRPSVK